MCRQLKILCSIRVKATHLVSTMPVKKFKVMAGWPKAVSCPNSIDRRIAMA